LEPQKNKWLNLFEILEIIDIVESKLQDKQHMHLIYQAEMMESERAKTLFEPLGHIFTSYLDSFWAANLLVI
jgi:hypothetical protein